MKLDYYVDNIVHPEEKTKVIPEYRAVLESNENRYRAEYRIIRPDGSMRWLDEDHVILRDINGNAVRTFSAKIDITERKHAEAQIKASLIEKETLLQEIHHRVKNNMQVISSLLTLQSNNITDNQIKEILRESQGRVYAMSAVHETLHRSENMSEIDLKTYLSKITTSIFQTYSVNHTRVTLKNDIENLPISINQAYPLGLVINELISNSLKYAFPVDRNGEISVSMHRRDQELEMVIKDDGVGIADELDWKNTNTLGLKLVQTLVENQLDGSIEQESQNGTKFTIKFNIENS